MRAVAAQLDMSVMALYRYVAGRQAIDLLVTDLIFGAVDPHVDPSLQWHDQVAELTTRARVAINAHPAAVPLLLANHQFSPNAWRWLESVLAALTKAGFRGRERIVAFRCLTAYVLGTIMNEFLLCPWPDQALPPWPHCPQMSSPSQGRPRWMPPL